MKEANKVGIMGGTFNPIHNGHLLIAQTALQQFALDNILFIPTGNPPHKKHITDAAIRYKMVELAIKDNENFLISDIEVNRETYSYTYLTLEELQENHPNTQYYFIMGADSLFDFEQWVNPHKIAQMAKLVVAVRDRIDIEQIESKIAYLKEKLGASILILDSPNFSISSHTIRESVAKSIDSVRYQLPDVVLDYIRFNHLYKEITSTDVNRLENDKGKDTMQQKIMQMAKLVKKELDKSRYEHTLGVMYTAASLAMAHSCDVEKAMLAGLLHDCAKCIPNDKKITLCTKYKLELTSIEQQRPYLVHAKLGACLAKEIYGIDDEDILHAIKVHTTGSPEMNLLDKIIYVADYIEPGRDKAPNLEKIRLLAFQDIDRTMLQILEDTLQYLEKDRSTIDTKTKETFEYFLKKEV